MKWSIEECRRIQTEVHSGTEGHRGVLRGAERHEGHRGEHRRNVERTWRSVEGHGSSVEEDAGP